MDVLVRDGPMYSSQVASIVCFRVFVRAERVSAQSGESQSRIYKVKVHLALLCTTPCHLCFLLGP